MEIQQNEYSWLPQRLAGLGVLANNLCWSWNPAARMLIKTLDRQSWKESGHNPDKMLKELAKEILDAAAEKQDYLRQYDAVLSQFNKYMETRECPLSLNGKIFSLLLAGTFTRSVSVGIIVSQSSNLQRRVT